MHGDAVAADESATLGQVNTSLGGYVTLGTAQTITAQKTFTTSGSSDTMIISHGSGSGFALDVIKAGSGEAIRVNKTSGSGNAMTVIGGNFEAPTIVRTGGTSSQFLKADGSVDSSTYLTTGTAASTYITIATPTTITGVKTFDTGTLILAAAGTANSTHLRNSSGDGTSVSGSNVFGFNSSNNIYVRTQSKGGFIFNFNNGAANRTYTLPDATGTISLTSDLGSYVPYTGATGAVDLGTHTLSSNNLIANGGLNAGALLLKNANAASTINTGYLTLSPSSTTTRVTFGFSTGASTWKSLSFSSHLLTDNTPTIFSFPNGGGTLAVTTDLGAYLPLTGGTLTGALNGTSASFTGGFELNTAGTGALGFFGANNTTDKYLRIRNSSGNFELGTSSSEHYLIGNGSIPLKFFTNGTPRLTIDGSTGAATFSSSVTANGFIASNSTANITLLNGTADAQQIRVRMSGNNGVLEVTRNSGTAPDLIFGTEATERMRITSAGNVGIGTASPSTKLTVSGGYSNFTDGTVNIYLGPDGSGGLLGTITNHYQRFITNDTERMRITSDAAAFLRMASGTGGIQFNGDTAAANALDDYEEGTWDMSAAPNTSGSITIDSGVNRGNYTKIGRLVTVTGLMEVSSVSSPIGTFIIVSGLPFAIGGRIIDYETRIGGGVPSLNTSLGNVLSAFTASEGSTSFSILINASTVQAGTQFNISFTYSV
jgi:hypothetical protein